MELVEFVGLETKARMMVNVCSVVMVASHGGGAGIATLCGTVTVAGSAEAVVATLRRHGAILAVLHQSEEAYKHAKVNVPDDRRVWIARDQVLGFGAREKDETAMQTSNGMILVSETFPEVVQILKDAKVWAIALGTLSGPAAPATRATPARPAEDDNLLGSL